MVTELASLQRFDPLGRILTYDNFDDGISGWTALCGNHDGDLDTVKPLFRDLQPPQLSSCNFVDIGTHGAMSGRYAMKVPTRAKKYSSGVAIRRLTMRALGRVQVEMYLAYKAEARLRPATADWDGNSDPSELEFGSFTISNDVCRPGGSRFHCALKYQNIADSGELDQSWYYKTGLQATTKRQITDPSLADVRDMHTTSPDEWEPIPDAHQPLCYNEVPTKINWHYLRWVFDTESGRNLELQVNDRTYDLSEIEVPQFPEKYAALDGLLNIIVDVQTHAAVRNFLFVDSVVVSVDW